MTITIDKNYPAKTYQPFFLLATNSEWERTPEEHAAELLRDIAATRMELEGLEKTAETEVIHWVYPNMTGHRGDQLMAHQLTWLEETLLPQVRARLAQSYADLGKTIADAELKVLND